MAQPTSQVGMASGHTGEYFYYPYGSGLWDAKNGAMLAKTGSGTVDSTGDAGQLVANGNGSTYYDMGADLTLAAPFTISFKVKRASATGDAGMVIGRRDGTASNYFWIRASEVRPFQTSPISTSGSDSWHTYTYVKKADGTGAFYKDETFVSTLPWSGGNTVLRYILSGFTGDSYALNGPLEYLHIIPGVEKSATDVAAMVSDPYAVLNAGATNTAPTFPGPNIGNQTGTVGTALASNVASGFSDSDALTFSAIGSWPPGVTVSSAGVIFGTPTTPGTYYGLSVRATDTAAQTVDSDIFSFTISPAAPLITVANSQQVNTASAVSIASGSGGTITLPVLKDWGTGNVKPNEIGITIIVNEISTGVLIVKLTDETSDSAGVVTFTDAALVTGSWYRVTTILADGSEGTWTYQAS